MSAAEGIGFKNELKKQHPQFDVLPCDICPSQLRKRGDVIWRTTKRRLDHLHAKDGNVRRVELKPIIREMAKEVVGIWEKASVACWGASYSEKGLKSCVR